MCSPSALIRVNYLVMRYLHFRNARGDLQEGHFTLPDATCLSFRAQNRHFCALLTFGTLVFGLFEHKIEVFVLFWPPEPLFLGLSSTKSRYSCAFGQDFLGFSLSRAQNQHFCARAEGQVASGSVKVTFLQFTAHTSKTQMPHNQIINF